MPWACAAFCNQTHTACGFWSALFCGFVFGVVMSVSYTITCHTEAQTLAFGAELSRLVLSTLSASAVSLSTQTNTKPFVVHLSGPLGVVKSRLCRAFLRALGVQGAIKSPSYALMEIYNLLNCLVYHLDLYRLSSPLELLEYGLLEPMQALVDQNVVCLVEWPEQAPGVLPQPDLGLQLGFVPLVQAPCGPSTEAALNEAARQLVLCGYSARGQAVLAGCQAWAHHKNNE